MTESLRLLMVEDQEELRELIGEALRDAGISVDTADDGQSALRMLRDSGPYDVVFSDIRMPNGMSGIELSEQVAQLLPQARVILASGFAKAQLPPFAGSGRFPAQTVSPAPAHRHAQEHCSQRINVGCACRINGSGSTPCRWQSPPVPAGGSVTGRRAVRPPADPSARTRRTLPVRHTAGCGSPSIRLTCA